MSDVSTTYDHGCDSVFQQCDVYRVALLDGSARHVVSVERVCCAPSQRKIDLGSVGTWRLARQIIQYSLKRMLERFSEGLKS